MLYNYFIGMLKKYETDRIKAFSGNCQCAIERVPSPFALLLGDVIRILHHNLDKLCKASEGLVLFGLQPASVMITSNQPVKLNRRFKPYDRHEHFCCTLDYQVVPKEQLNKLVAWEQTSSIVVDFTVGKVMNSSQYLNHITREGIDVEGLGQINKYVLATVWTILHVRESTFPKKKGLHTSQQSESRMVHLS